MVLFFTAQLRHEVLSILLCDLSPYAIFTIIFSVVEHETLTIAGVEPVTYREKCSCALPSELCSPNVGWLPILSMPLFCGEH